MTGSILLGTVPAGSKVEATEGGVLAFLPDGSAKHFTIGLQDGILTSFVTSVPSITIRIGTR